VRDTSAEARKAQIRALRQLAPSARLALACELSDGAVSLTAAGTRLRDPGLSDQQVADAIRRLLLGVDMAEQLRSEHRLPG
jgi:hypothetical protein